MAGEIINLNDTNPAPPSLALNVTWQKGATPTGTDPLSGYPIYPVSASLPYMVGDTGSGGAAGLAPPPPSGSGAAGFFLRADGSWAASLPTPTFVQGISAAASPGTFVATSLSAIGVSHTLIVHVRSGTPGAPSIVSSAGNTYTLAHTVTNNFWGVYTYTYICLAALSGAETVTATFGASSGLTAILAEYTPATGYESVADNGVGGNANVSSNLDITSTKGYERGVWFFSCGAFSGLSLTQPIQEQGGGGVITLCDATAIANGTVNLTATSSAFNQPAITGLFLTWAGSVFSVGLSAPAILTVSGSPITTAGVIALGLANQAANLVWAGPTSGSASAPAFRALVAADMPSGTGTVTSISLAMPAEFSVAGSPVTSSGGFSVTKASQSANLVYAGPASGSAAAPAFRALAAADLPLATTGAAGAVRPDGATVLVSAGVISIPAATISALGLVKPDGSTITISAGVISASSGSPLTTKGDLYGYNTGNARVPIGANAQVLTADSTQPLGLGWAAPPLVVQFVLSSGASGTNVGPMLAAPRAGQITKCVVCTKLSDGSVGLSLRILKNGVNVFSSNPSVAAGTAQGTVSTVGTLTSSPLSIAASDVFSIDILTGTASWQFSVQLE